jgi:glucosamine--fructose-6-phosphate aminotransferase (isomerizing)
MSGPALDPALGAATEREIRSIPALWRRLADRLHDEAAWLSASLEGASSVTFLGCGSAYISGQTAAELLRPAGVHATAEVASDYVLRPGAASDGRAVAIAVSRSGETSETCAAVEAFRARTKGTVVAATCRPASRLAGLADRTIGLPEADEKVVPQTRSVSAFLMLWTLLAGVLEGEDRREAIVRAAGRIDAVADALWTQLAQSAQSSRYVLLGGGAGHRLGEEAALKLTEMGRVPAWAWRALEYRHGPLEALDDRTTVVGPLGVELSPAEHAAVQEAAGTAGAVVDVGALVGPVPPAAGLLAQLYSLFALSLLAARAGGRDADAPALIRAFVDDVDLGVA